MKRLAAFLACLICFGLLVSAVLAGGEGKNSICLGFAKPGKGQTVVAEGTYSLADGYTLCGVTVQARPLKDGEGGQSSAFTESGNFYASVEVPLGTYDVQAILQVKDSKGEVCYYFSEVTCVFVE